MSIIEQNPYIQYESGTSELTFNIPFPFENPEDIQCIITGNNGIQTPLVYQQDYSVEGAGSVSDEGYYTGGTLTLVTWIPAASVLTILRQGPYQQLSSYPQNTLLDPTQIESDLDSLEMQIQQLAEISNRALTVPIGSQDDPTQFTNDFFQTAQDLQASYEEAQSLLEQTQGIVTNFSSSVDEGVQTVQEATQEAIDTIEGTTQEAKDWASVAQSYAQDNKDYIQTHSIWTTDNVGDLMPVNNTIITEDPDWELDSAGDIMPKEEN